MGNGESTKLTREIFRNLGTLSKHLRLQRFRISQINANTRIKMEIFVELNIVCALCPHSIRNTCDGCIWKEAWLDWSASSWHAFSTSPIVQNKVEAEL